MIAAAALCPQALVLLPGLGGRTDAVPDLRRACAAAVDALLASSPEEVVLLGEAAPAGEHQVSPHLGLHRFGVGAGTAARAATPGPVVPLPFVLGSVLLDAAGWHGPRRWLAVPPGSAGAAREGARLDEGPVRTAVLALGDGTACRTLKAPGHLDERAEAFDQALLVGVQTDLPSLLELDPGLASQLLVQGLAAWQALAGALSVRHPGQGMDLLWAGDPFGVQYAVAQWSDEQWSDKRWSGKLRPRGREGSGQPADRLGGG